MGMSDKFKDKAEQMKREASKKMDKKNEEKDRSQHDEGQGKQNMTDRAKDEAKKRSDDR